jgi:hypothetical protein
MTDSFSYALGVQVAGFYRQQGVKKLKLLSFSKALLIYYAIKNYL